MTTIVTLIFFILGLIIGSFLNVVILRLNTKKSLGGRSACMSCQNKLSWYELIPVFSFFTLGGRCRTCKTKISAIYPVVELLTGLVFAGLFLKFQNILLMNPGSFFLVYAYYTIAFSVLIVIAVYDAKHKIIPDTLSFFLMIFSFVGLFLFDSNYYLILSPHLPGLMNLFSGVFIALPFFLFWYVSKGTWMGLGDAKLGLSLGWLLGFSQALSGVALAFWIGAVGGITLVAFSKRHGMKSEIPFAPYLVLGAFIAFLFALNLFGPFY